jgi:hypothetical protein
MNFDHVRAAWVVLVIATHGATACHLEERDHCVIEPCDISRDACQREVFEAIACARDYDGASPPVEVISFWEYQSRNDEPALTLRDLQVANAFVTLGFTPTIESLTESYGNPIAYYSPQAGRVTIVESDDDDDIRILVLLHAFANAQQDVEYDLERLFGQAAVSYDAALAMNATVYGESFFSAAIAWDRSVGTAASSPRDLVSEMQNTAKNLAADANAALPIVNAAFAVGFGGRLYSERWNPGHDYPAEIAALLSSPPETTRAVLWNELPGEPPTSVPAPVLDIEAPHQVVVVDTFGAWMASTFMRRAGASAMSRAWRGDRFTLVGGEAPADIGIHWRIDLGASAADVGEQIREASASRPWFVHVAGESLIIVAAFDLSSLDAWVERFGLMP